MAESKMSALTEFRDRRNLERAWRWIRSNPDPTYKRYCGEMYSRFAIADDLIIDEVGICFTHHTPIGCGFASAWLVNYVTPFASKSCVTVFGSRLILCCWSAFSFRVWAYTSSRFFWWFFPVVIFPIGAIPISFLRRNYVQSYSRI